MSIFQEVPKDGHVKPIDKEPDALQQFMLDVHQSLKTLADPNEPLHLQNEKAEQKNEIAKSAIDSKGFTFLAWSGQQGDQSWRTGFDRVMASVDSGTGTRNLHDYNPEPTNKVGQC